MFSVGSGVKSIQNRLATSRSLMIRDKEARFKDRGASELCRSLISMQGASINVLEFIIFVGFTLPPPVMDKEREIGTGRSKRKKVCY